MSKKPDRYFKIRNKNTGLYSTGTCHYRWTAKGKIWIGSGPLRSHLNLVRHFAQLDDWEIVELSVTEAASYSPYEMINIFKILKS